MKRKSRRKRASIPIDEIPYDLKMIAVYGYCRARVNILERVLKTRVDGVKQHYWMKTGRTELCDYSARFEFYGMGRDLGRAVVMTDHLVPRVDRRFQVISARDFIENPYRYSQYGHWIRQEVES